MGKIKVLVFISLIFCASLCFSFDIVKSARVDLNGDGKAENILLSDITESGEFVLKVDKISIKGRFTMSWEAEGFAIVDIDTKDKYKEIAVYSPGPSDDDEYLIYWYDGNSIKEMGRLSRWPKFLGNGTILVGDWMGFWKKREKYVLNNKTRTLQLIPQELYYVGIEVVVKESFPIYRSRKDSKILANLKPNSKILILLCDPSPFSHDEVEDYYSDWYLIKSEKGLVGWARLRAFCDKLEGLPWAD